jgi:hypothetical protein
MTPWLKLVKKIKAQHPTWLLKDVLKEASKIYQK